MFDPFAWSTWSFWMTCYYSLWLEYKINSPWLLRLAGLAWSGLLQSSVDLVLFFLGSVLESPVALGLISFCLLSVGAACWCSYFFDLAFELLDAIFSFIVGQSFFPLALSNNFCLLILFCVFYFSPSKTKGISS